MQKTIRNQVDSKKPAAPFMPTGTISDCSGGCFSGKCNMCKYKQANGTLLASLDHTYTGPDAGTVARNKKAYA